MAIRTTISPFVALFASLWLLLTGGGLLGTLLSVRMTLEWFPTPVIGLVAACYSVGFVVATRVCGRTIARVGHIRSFAAFAAIAASTTLVYPMLVEPVLWGAMRVFYGFSMAGLYIVTESWLNDRTPREYRGQVLGVYSIVLYGGMGGGQFLLMVGEPGGFELFSLAAMLIALALVPVTVVRTSSPELLELRPVRLRDLYAASPLGLAGAAMAGVINGAFLSMAPVFAQGAGFSRSDIAILMGLTIVGGFLLQWPIGRLSDLYNRRGVIGLVSLAVALVSAAIILATGRSDSVVIGLAVLWGGLAFTIYPIAVSLTNDYVEPAQTLGASAGMLLVHGCGMIAGPIIAAGLMGLTGPGGLFWTIMWAALGLAMLAWFRQRVGPPLEVAEVSPYRAMASGTGTAYASALDPNLLENQLELDFGDDSRETESGHLEQRESGQ